LGSSEFQIHHGVLNFEQRGQRNRTVAPVNKQRRSPLAIIETPFNQRSFCYGSSSIAGACFSSWEDAGAET
jgi:hypothetical protein